ncbi:MAG: DUF1302 domain-containing protein [Rhodocyclales bacterium]|nr:DUF1302 domain-containing protein [Rhodocyclales bacterium]
MLVAGLATIGSYGQAYAFEVTADGDVAVRWDNTLKYSVMQRLKDPSPGLINAPAGNIAGLNFDDGDRNFNKGIVSNRLDWLSELDVVYKGSSGFRVSGAAWYDAVYNRSNDNNSQATVNSASAPAGQFASGTRSIMGRKAELLDAFVFAQGDLGGMPSSGRLGKHTVLYGETLFFGANGIAGGQAPVDVVKALSVPNTQFKEILMPVQQLSGQVQLTSNVSVGGYYQFKWKKTRIPPSGSYFSNFDPVDAGGERGFLFTGAPAPFGPLTTITRATNDIEAKKSGQGGLQLRWRPEGVEADVGFYAIRYHEKTPQFYVYPYAAPLPGIPNTYKLVYPENISAYGASFSTVLGDANVAGELSIRRNTPLVSRLAILTQAQALTADNDANPLYAVGNSAHFNLSAMLSLPHTALWEGGFAMAEIGWNRRTSITKNPGALDLNVERDAWGFRFVFEPAYFQVLPGLDITVPIGLGYNPKGKSSVVSGFNGGVDKGGDVSIGINGEYEKTWKLSAKYVHYLGDENVKSIPYTPAILMNSFAQTLKDRDFLSFSIQRAF